MLGELRTIALSPQKYYELYMQVWNELRHLEAFFADEVRHGRTNLEMYELVQHAGNILPRLYLLITVGAVYIKSKEGAAKDVLKDLVEMAKGVQQPIHGLFLRTYLSQSSKNLLPDTGSEYEGEGGNVHDAVEFVLQNFTEMNKLWVRMQHSGPQRDRERREQERQELRDLVGKNLLVLTQLEGMDLELYKNTVLPRVLEQVVNCKDEIAQPYLMDAIVQVFPDEFHLQTLEKLLEACPSLRPNVKVGNVLASLMDRLTNHAQETPEMVSQFVEVDAFGKFSACVKAVVAAQPTMEAHDRLLMHAALMSFVTAVHRERLDYVDGVLSSTAEALGASVSGGGGGGGEGGGGGGGGGENGDGSAGANGDRTPASQNPLTPSPPMIVSDQKGVRQLVALLTVPLDTYDVVSVLRLSSYPRVMALLQPANYRQMAVTIVRSVLRSRTRVDDVDQVETLFRFISVLVRDRDPAVEGGDAGAGGLADDVDEEDFEEEQNLVARLVHQLRSDDSDTQYRLLVAARKQFGQGGPRRLKHTLPPLAFEALRLGRTLVAAAQPDLPPGSGEDATAAAAAGGDGGAEGVAAARNGGISSAAGGAAAAAGVASGPMGPALKKLLQFLHQTVAALADVGEHDVALRLFLEAAKLADASGMEPIAYEFFERAMTIYEDEISDSQAQKTALSIIVGTLQRCVAFTAESRDSLVHKATGYSARLLKKPDQCVAVAACSHLFWGPAGVDGAARDPDSVVVCLKKSLKIASAAQQAANTTGAGAGAALSLFITVLNKYLYFLDQGVPSVTLNVVQGLLEVINNELASGETQVPPDVEAYYSATLRHIRHQKSKGGEIGARYEGLAC